MGADMTTPDSVHRFVRSWREERARVPAHAYVPMSFAPGEAYQFDWRHETITLQGLPLTVKAAQMKLSHSRSFEFIFVRPKSWCSTPTTRRSSSMAGSAGAASTTIYGRLPRKAIRWGRRLECTNLSGL